MVNVHVGLVSHAPRLQPSNTLSGSAVSVEFVVGEGRAGIRAGAAVDADPCGELIHRALADIPGAAICA